jgi:hypothetical protein
VLDEEAAMNIDNLKSVNLESHGLFVEGSKTEQPHGICG